MSWIIGKKFTAEHLKKLSIARQGRKPMLGKKHSLETKQKFSVVFKKRWANPKYKAKMTVIRKALANQNPGMMNYVASFVKKGDQSSQWHGDNVQYFGIHKWLIKTFGKATHCENKGCLLRSKIIKWAKLRDVEYKRRRENFIMLCNSCHVKYDKKNSNFNIIL